MKYNRNEMLCEEAIEISKIKVPPNERTQSQSVDLLIESIRDVGLINPLIVDEEFNLISGFLRYKALMAIDKDQLVAVRVLNEGKDKLKLAKIDENLVRYALTSLEESIAIDEKALLIEKLRRSKPDVEIKNVANFLAENMGISPRKIFLDRQIARLDDDTKLRVRGTPIENQKQNLAKLARAKEEDRKSLIEALLGIDNTKLDTDSQVQLSLSDFFQQAKILRSKFKNGSPENELIEIIKKIKAIISSILCLTVERSDQKRVQNEKVDEV